MTPDHDDHRTIGSDIVAAAAQGCPEARLLMNRRNLLGLSAGLFTWAHAPRLASAAATSDPRLLIVLLRGGLDGLNVLPYYDDNSYGRAARGTLYLEKDAQRTLTNFSGYRLNAVMVNFQAMFNAGNARIVLPIAPPLQTRSHFDCSFNLENGLERSARSDSGWLNRLFTYLPANKKAALHDRPLHVGNTPVIVTGAEPVFSWSPWVSSPDFFKTGSAATLRAIYAKTAPQLADKLADGFAMDTTAVGRDEDKPYTDTLQKSFIGAARLLGAQTGPRIAVVTADNFDTHVQEGNNTSKVLANLDAGLGLFAERAKSLGIWDKTLVVCVSEFGRTIGDNGKGGCDHGIGSTALLAGGVISRSSIIGNWPNLLDNSVLGDNNDIPALYDTRDLFKAVLREHLGIDDRGTTSRIINTHIFPGVDTLPRGVVPLTNLLG